MKLGNIPSLSGCIIKNDSVVWSGGYGYYDNYYSIRHRKEASNDTIYLIGSITKTIIATALLQLYERGLINLSDNVNDRLPFNLTNPNYPTINITYKMLLAHQSSLEGNYNFNRVEITINHFINLLALLRASLPEDPYPWLEEIIVPEIWGDYSPGEKFAYSNLGFITLGYLIELITNQSLEDYCQDNIFTPLDMMNTSFHYEDLDTDRLAVPYIRLPVRGFGIYIPLPQYDKRCAKSAGGIRSTVSDLSHFLIAHMNGGVYKDKRILKNSTIELMHKPAYPNSNYGLGWMIGPLENNETIEGHSGGIYGFISYMYIYRTNNVGVIYFYNGWYPPLFSKKSFSLNKELADALILTALFQKANEF